MKGTTRSEAMSVPLIAPQIPPIDNPDHERDRQQDLPFSQ